jgi:hypothetical protein
MAEKKKPKNLDDFFKDLQNTHTPELDKAFKEYDKFNKRENTNDWYNNTFKPAQDSLYNTIKTKLDELFENDEAKVHGKKKDIQKAVLEGLKEYFQKIKPSLTKLMDDLDMNEDEQYEFLAAMYDEHTGALTSRAAQREGVQSIRTYVEQAKDKKATVGDIKHLLNEQAPLHMKHAIEQLRYKHQTHHLGKYHSADIAAYLKPKIEKEGFEIEDKLGYATSDIKTLLDMRSSVVEKERRHQYLKEKKSA